MRFKHLLFARFAFSVYLLSRLDADICLFVATFATLSTCNVLRPAIRLLVHFRWWHFCRLDISQQFF